MTPLTPNGPGHGHDGVGGQADPTPLSAHSQGLEPEDLVLGNLVKVATAAQSAATNAGVQDASARENLLIETLAKACRLRRDGALAGDPEIQTRVVLKSLARSKRANKVSFSDAAVVLDSAAPGLGVMRVLSKIQAVQERLAEMSRGDLALLRMYYGGDMSETEIGERLAMAATDKEIRAAAEALRKELVAFYRAA